jgi:hypothetical protein
VQVSLAGIDLNIVGIILMVVGALGLILSIFLLSSWSGRRGEGRTVVREERDDVL